MIEDLEPVAGYEDFYGNLTGDAFDAYEDKVEGVVGNKFYVLRFEGNTEEEI